MNAGAESELHGVEPGPVAREHETEVAIVGGGPAGLVAACLLAREGVDVLVIEKGASFAREFRGEILQPRFQQALRDVDLYEQVAALPHDDIDGAHIYFAALRVGQVDARWLDCKNPRIWWMTQPTLLDGLHRYAERFANYELWFDARATQLLGERNLLVQRGGDTIRVRAKVIVGADGRFSQLRKLGHFPIAYDRHDIDVVWFVLDRPENYKHYFSFFVGLSTAFLILPKHPAKLQCGMVFRPGRYKKAKRKGIERFRNRLRRSHPAFATFADSLTDFKPFVPLNGTRALVKTWAKDGVLLIGDAAHTCSPAGGIGVAIAVETACVAARVIKDGLERGDLSDAWLDQVQATREPQVRAVHAIQGQARLVLAPLFWPLRLLVPLFAGVLSASKIIPLVARRVLAQREAMPPHFEGSLTVSEALELYFERSGFGRETYTDRWVRLPIGPFTLYLPNLKPRQEVVPLHDVDHVISEYATDWSGEFQISGYELGKGLGKYWFGWIIDLQGIWPALLFYPRKTLRAFARGRRSGCLYREFAYDDELLKMTVGELRSKLGIVAKPDVEVRASDLTALAGRLLLSVLVHAPLLGTALALYWLIMR